MKKSHAISGEILNALENLHRRLSRIENKFLGALTDGNPDNSDDAQEHGNPSHPNAAHWREDRNPSGPSPEQKERIKDAFEYTYRELFSDDGQRTLIPGFSDPAPNHGFQEFRTPLANSLQRRYMNDALGGSIPVDVWLHEFCVLSKDKNRVYRGQRNFNAHAGMLARDIVVRALINKGVLSSSDTEKILLMETD